MTMILRRAAVALLSTCLLSVAGAAARAETLDNFPDRQALILNNCPSVELAAFSYGNEPAGPGPRLVERLAWKNVGNQPIVAIEVVLLKYDAFNRRMESERWTVTGKNSADWRPLTPGDGGTDALVGLESQPVLTEIAYVRIVRLADGTLWHASSDSDLLKEMHRLAPGIHDFGAIKPEPSPRTPAED
jgi:hypothetical protein